MGALRRLASWRHGFWYLVSEALRFSRGTKHEVPAESLHLEGEAGLRIAQLRARYEVRFESRLNQKSSVNNYEYLDLLDRGFAASSVAVPSVRTLCDVGCASFWYAPALQCFFRPQQLIGVEVEGYRLLRDWHTRIDYARGYLSGVKDAQFVVADYADYAQSADLITAFFPFLTASAVLAWRLPLWLLTPERLFARVAANLAPGGLFFMMNHGLAEAALAHQCCVAAKLQPIASWEGAGALSSYRLEPPVLSWWRHAAPINLR